MKSSTNSSAMAERPHELGHFDAIQ